MSTRAGVDYSAWDHIYVSDDEDVASPYVDTPSLFRMRHRARLEKMAEFQQKGEDLENNFAQCRRLLEEAQGRLRELQQVKKEGEEDEEQEAELKRVQTEVRELKKDEKAFEKMMEQYRREEKKLPWNVDTISKEGFSKSVLNIQPVTKEEREEEVEKHKTFVQKYTKEIKHFGMLRRWDDSQKYLSDNPHLVCEETANYLVVICIDFEIDEKHALMEQVAHQAIVMQFILDLARTLKVDPRGCFRQFFSKIKTADKPYQDAFDRELELLKERVRSCAQIRMEDAMKEVEEEERQKRLGPGGLDPVEVYESLPKEIQRSFDEKNIQMLQEALSKLDPEEGKYHLRRCIDSGLWVPDSGEGHDEDEDEDEEEG
ncbi:hsp90 co-chaperone Cdc37-like isoform X1 [Seriola lalandi dorsalis]|uniref:Hsp90 co-chaperone Cdc37 n=2 Tax=Seriola lalandi dorsalis TaxID=1841481 RepID=A0A3B4XC38_SERLL|nr:hsp90 co-chaperone Cdc37-like isoform X1 [Seriola lalandi dorsalis]